MADPEKKQPPTDLERYLDLRVKLYQPPLSKLRDSGAIADLTQPISVFMLVMDFDTEVAMNGIYDFIGNSTGRYANETVEALVRIGCPEDAALLKRLLAVASGAGMTHATIQNDRREQAAPLHSVTSFAATHGDKWDAALAKIDQIEKLIDFDRIGRHVAAFVATHRETLAAEP